MDDVPASGPPPPREPGARRGDAWLAFALALVVLAVPAGSRDLWDADEGRYAAVALDMRRAGDFVTPREDGMRFVDKPPLLYWAENAAFTVLGTNAFAARFPCVVAGAALAAIAFLFGRALGRSRLAGYGSAGIAATSLSGVGFSRTVTMDMPLAAAIAGALWFGYRAVRHAEARAREDGRGGGGGDAGSHAGARVGLGACVGLGLLAKGPLAGAVPAFVAIAWGVVGVPWRAIARVLFSPLAWAVALVVAAPWYALMERANPGYLRHFLVYEHFGRYAEKGTRDFAPVWLYVAVLPWFVLPWTFLLVRSRVRAPALAGRKGPVSGERLLGAWVVACLVLYSGGRNRLFTYILPAALPLFVLAGARLAALVEEGRARCVSWWLAAQGALVAAAGAAVALGALARLGPHALADGRLRALGWPVAFASAPLLAAPFVVRRRALAAPARAAGALLACVAAFFAAADAAAAAADPLRSARALADTLAREQGPRDAIVVLDAFPQGLRWYRDVSFAVAGKQREIVPPWSQRDGEGRLLDEAALRDLWRSPRRVLLVVREAKASPWRDAGGRVLAGRLSGDQRADLLVLENRARAR